MPTQNRADLVAAWAVGIGVGLIALQLTWLIANRITSLMWEAPRGPIIAFTTAMVVGVVTSTVVGHKLAKSSARREIAITTSPHPTLRQ